MRDDSNQYIFADPGASHGGQDIFLASRFPQGSQRIRADLTASSR